MSIFKSSCAVQFNNRQADTRRLPPWIGGVFTKWYRLLSARTGSGMTVLQIETIVLDTFILRSAHSQFLGKTSATFAPFSRLRLRGRHVRLTSVFQLPRIAHGLTDPGPTV